MGLYVEESMFFLLSYFITYKNHYIFIYILNINNILSRCLSTPETKLVLGIQLKTFLNVFLPSGMLVEKFLDLKASRVCIITNIFKAIKMSVIVVGIESAIFEIANRILTSRPWPPQNFRSKFCISITKVLVNIVHSFM